MSLTETGRTFHASCERILADLDEAEAEVSDRHGALSGTLRAAAPLTFGAKYLTPVIVDFMRENPGVVVDLDFSDRVTDLVAEGFEMAIRIGTLRDSSLIARKLTDVRVIACASPALLKRHGTPQHPDQLRDWPALCYSGSERSDIWRYRAPDGVEGSVAMQVRTLANNGGVLRDAAIAGLGIVLQPSFVVHEAVERGDLVTVLRAYRWPPIAIYTVYPQTRHLSARARAFIDFVRKRIGPRPYWEAFLDAPNPGDAGG